MRWFVFLSYCLWNLLYISYLNYTLICSIATFQVHIGQCRPKPLTQPLNLVWYWLVKGLCTGPKYRFSFFSWEIPDSVFSVLFILYNLLFAYINSLELILNYWFDLYSSDSSFLRTNTCSQCPQFYLWKSC